MMKKNRLFVMATVLAFVFTASFCFGQQGVKPGVKNSYNEVTSKLDKGGNIFIYVSTERVVKTVDDFVTKLSQIAQSSADTPDQAKETMAIFDFIYGMIKRSGLTEISGVGFSSVPVSENLNHSKTVIHHYKENSSGLIWKLYETSPHKLTELRMLPANTSFAAFGTSKLNALWNWIKKEAELSKIPALEKISKLDSNLLKSGIDLNKMLEAMSNGAGYVFTLDNTKKCKLPFGAKGMEIPDPGLALVITVKDDYLLNFFSLMFGNKTPVEEKGIKSIPISIPKMMPFTLEPAVMQKGNTLILTSSKKMAEEMFSAMEKGNGLISTPEFKKMSANIPDTGNGFSYSNGELFKLIMSLQQKDKGPESDSNPAETEAYKNIMNLFWKDMESYSVMQTFPEGLIWISNQTMNYENLVLLPVTFGVGVISAIAIPNALTANQKGKQKATIGDMKAVAQAIESYMTDFYYAPKGKTLKEVEKDLVPFHIKNLPLKDAWGNDFLYLHGTGKDQDVYYIASPGRDGVFNGWDQKGFYPIKTMKDFDNDIIFANGAFVYGPEFKHLSGPIEKK